MKGIHLSFLIIYVSISGCAQSSHCTYPQAGWENVSLLEQAEWNTDSLNQLRNFIVHEANTTGMLVIYKGKVLFEYGNVKDNSYIASCRKSILSMLYGPFVKNGTINLDESLEQLALDDIGGLLPIERTATIRELLTARSGVYHAAANKGDQTDRAPVRGSVKPGSYFLYNNWDFNAAGYVLESKTRKSIYDLIESVLATPLGMQDWNKSIQRKYGDSTRSRFPAYHMWFSTRDMARIGYLMLRNGNWNGRQVIDEAWVKTITSCVTPFSEAKQNDTNFFNFSYGYLWWLWDDSNSSKKYHHAFTASGAFGQFITVIPSLDIVVAHKTNYDDYRRSTSTETYLAILDKIVNAKRPKTLLAVIAHPDDELLMGGVLAHYASKGVKVQVAVATDGALGVTNFSHVPAGPKLAAVRRMEMICSADALGISRPIFLGMPDQLKTTEGKLQQQIDILRKSIDSLFNVIRPDAILTFGAEGWTGHPDHRIVGIVTTEVYASRTWPGNPGLFYSALPTGSITKESWAQFLTVDSIYLTTKIRLDDQDYIKLRNAFNCHQTQYRESVRQRLPLFHEQTQKHVAMFRQFWPSVKNTTSLFHDE